MKPLSDNKALLSKRHFVQGLSIPFLLPLFSSLAACDNDPYSLRHKISQLDIPFEGKLGLSFKININGIPTFVDINGDERFGMCSTFKLPLAAMILHQIDQGLMAADERIAITESDILGYAPITKKHLEHGYMSLLALAEAAQRTSDNTAANLLLSHIGGPAAFTQNMRNIGDDVTRLDRLEPQLNLVPTGEVRDTTTPNAMARSLEHIFESDYLSPQSKSLLKQWMVDTETGLNRVRAGLPKDWIAGDKTGTGIAPSMANKHNDIGVIWPPNHPPIHFAAYYEAPQHYDNMRPEDDIILKNVGNLIFKIYKTNI